MTIESPFTYNSEKIKNTKNKTTKILELILNILIISTTIITTINYIKNGTTNLLFHVSGVLFIIITIPFIIKLVKNHLKIL